jgi:hypothetical protein
VVLQQGYAIHEHQSAKSALASTPNSAATTAPNNTTHQVRYKLTKNNGKLENAP